MEGSTPPPHRPGTPAARGWLSPSADPTKGGCPGAGRSGGPARPPRGRPHGRGWRTRPVRGGGGSSQHLRTVPPPTGAGMEATSSPRREAAACPRREGVRMGTPARHEREPAPRRAPAVRRGESRARRHAAYQEPCGYGVGRRQGHCKGDNTLRGGLGIWDEGRRTGWVTGLGGAEAGRA